MHLPVHLWVNIVTFVSGRRLKTPHDVPTLDNASKVCKVSREAVLSKMPWLDHCKELIKHFSTQYSAPPAFKGMVYSSNYSPILMIRQSELHTRFTYPPAPRRQVNLSFNTLNTSVLDHVNNMLPPTDDGSLTLDVKGYNMQFTDPHGLCHPLMLKFRRVNFSHQLREYPFVGRMVAQLTNMPGCPEVVLRSPYTQREIILLLWNHRADFTSLVLHTHGREFTQLMLKAEDCCLPGTDQSIWDSQVDFTPCKTMEQIANVMKCYRQGRKMRGYVNDCIGDAVDQYRQRMTTKKRPSLMKPKSAKRARWTTKKK